MSQSWHQLLREQKYVSNKHKIAVLFFQNWNGLWGAFSPNRLLVRSAPISFPLFFHSLSLCLPLSLIALFSSVLCGLSYPFYPMGRVDEICWVVQVSVRSVCLSLVLKQVLYTFYYSPAYVSRGEKKKWKHSKHFTLICTFVWNVLKVTLELINSCSILLKFKQLLFSYFKHLSILFTFTCYY